MEDTAFDPHFPKLFLVDTIGSTLGDMEGIQILRHRWLFGLGLCLLGMQIPPSQETSSPGVTQLSEVFQR